jgi:hypothetical protein
MEGLPMRFLVALGLVLVFTGLSARAGGGPPVCGGLDPDVIAQIVLEDDGSLQGLVAQALREADRDTLVRVIESIRRLAPEVEKARASRGPEPDPSALGDGPLHVVSIDVRFLDAESEFLRDLSVDMGGPGTPGFGPGADGSTSVGFLDEVQREVILRAVEKGEHVTPMSASQITVYDRQRANFSVVDNKTFVVEVRPVERGNGSVTAQPVLDSAQEGLVLCVRPTLSVDRKYVTLEILLLTADLVGPRAPRSVVCAGQTIPLTMPTTCLHLARSTLRMPDGGTVLIDQRSMANGRSRLALVSARHVETTGRELREGKPAAK